MTPEEFAKRIRDKFPDGVSSDGIPYKEMDDVELAKKVVGKFPIYKSQVKFEPMVIGSPIEAGKELISGIGEAIGEREKAIGEEFARTKESPLEHLRTGLRVTGQVAGGVSDIAFEGLKFLAPKFVENIAARGVEKITETDIAQKAFQKYEEIKGKHPEAVKDFEAIFNIGSLIPVGKGIQVAGKGLKVGAKRVSKIAGEVLDARRIARVEQATKEIDSVVGKIVQGKRADIEQAKRALSSLDTKDITTYTGLREKIDDGVEALATKLDDHLDTAGASVPPLKSKDLVTSTQVGKTIVKQNFVDDAIKQLKELYGKIKDAPSLAKIKELEKKLAGEGLTLRELNDLARKYGREFGNKAFSKLGDPLTSVNAQAFENTRKGVKEAVRSQMPDDVAKTLDKSMSDLINTNRLVKKMEERVNALYQKAKKRGVLEQVARKAADIVNVATFGTISGFVSRLLPSNVGLKVLNSIDLEKALSKNLNKLDDLLKITDDKKLTNELIKFLKEIPQETP